MKATLVDTLTTVVFFTAVAATTELLIAGMTPAQVATARGISVPLMLLTGRPYGLWRDTWFRRVRPRHRIAAAVVDTAAFLSFQVPVYAVALIVAGADTGQMVRAAASAVVGMLILGRPFGLVLDRVRRICGTAPG